MPNIGWPELLIVLVIALVIFGPKRLPDMGRQLGRGLREFKKATSEIQDHFDLSLEDKDDAAKETPADVRPAAATTVPVVEASVAQAAAPQAADTPAAAVADAAEVVEGQIVGEEADRPAQTVAG
jgi:sec-independent protein translocase protein TatA